MNRSATTRPASRRRRWIVRVTALLGSVLLLGSSAPGFGSEPAFTEYQIKALCLLNFAKYVEWPMDAFPETNGPLYIGIIGENRFDGHLQAAVEGKTIAGRPVNILRLKDENDWSKCHVLFVSSSEKSHLTDILNKTRNSPVLTVGECDQFNTSGGIINFVMKEGKVRFEIDLAGARSARLKISSKLLSLADKVAGKP